MFLFLPLNCVSALQLSGDQTFGHLLPGLSQESYSAIINCTSTVQLSLGDSCESVAAAQGIVQVSFLSAGNPFLNCSDLIPGSFLCVSAPEVVSSSCSLTYVSKQNESCNALSAAYNLTNDQFVTLNPSLNCRNLRSGAVVCLDGKSGNLTISGNNSVAVSNVTNIPECTSKITLNGTQTCLGISASSHVSLSDLFSFNQGLNCWRLKVGDEICTRNSSNATAQISSNSSVSTNNTQIIPPNTPLTSTPVESESINGFAISSCKFRMILKMLSEFETGSPDLNFGACWSTSDGQGISAGFVQFTSCGGQLRQFCSNYLDARPNNFCRNYMDALRDAYGAYHCNDFSSKVTPAGLGNFCNDFAADADVPEFQNAQMLTLEQHNFDPIIPLMQQYNIKSPLFAGFILDTVVQLGQVASNFLYSIQQDLGNIGSSATEEQWFQAFVQRRTSTLLGMGGAYSATLYRVDAYQGVFNTYGLYFPDSITMLRSGARVSISC